eukprot:6986724-Lingulodinium_polyedra.AAC.1
MSGAKTWTTHPRCAGTSGRSCYGPRADGCRKQAMRPPPPGHWHRPKCKGLWTCPSLPGATARWRPTN